MAKQFTWGEAVETTLRTRPTWRNGSGRKPAVINCGHFTRLQGLSFPCNRINVTIMEDIGVELEEEGESSPLPPPRERVNDHPRVRAEFSKSSAPSSTKPWNISPIGSRLPVRALRGSANLVEASFIMMRPSRSSSLLSSRSTRSRVLRPEESLPGNVRAVAGT